MILIAAVATGAWLSYRQLVDSERAYSLRHAEDVAHVLEMHTRDLLESVDDAVRHIKGEYERNGGRADLRDIMNSHRDVADYAAVATVADEWGRLVLSNLPMAPETSIADREHFRAHMEHDSGRPFIGKPIIGRVSGKQSFHVTRRINRSDGSFGGVAGVSVDLSYWSRLLSQGTFGSSSAIALLGRDGVARAMHSRNGAAEDTAQWPSLIGQIDGARTRGTASFDEPGPGGARTWTYRVMSDYPLVVAAAVDDSEIARHLAAVRYGYAGGAAVIALLAGLFAAALILFLARQRVHFTERTRAAEAARASEERFRTIFDHADIGITLRAAQDRHSPWLAVNDKFCELTGYRREDLLRLSTADITPDDEHEVAVRKSEQLLRGEVESYTREKQIVRRDGSRIWVVLSVALLRDAEKRPHGIIATYQDVTARRLAEDRLRENEERLRAIITAEPECVKIVGADGSLLDMNPAGLAMLEARTLDEARRQPLIDYILPQYRGAFANLHRRVMAGASGILEFELVGLAGAHRWLETHAVPMRDAAGNIHALLGITRDVTARRAGQEALAGERNLLRTIIDNLPDYIHVKDRERRFILANQAWMKARAPGHRDVTGQNIEDVLPPERALMFAQEDREVMVTGRAGKPRETVWEAPEGGTRWFMTTKIPLRDASDAVIGTIGISRDVTELRQRALEVEVLNAALEERVAERTTQLTIANQELESFTYSVSHDLRAPLRHIVGFSVALLQDHGERLDASARDFLNRIRSAGLRMGALIEDLLRLSQVTRAELHKSEVDLSALMTEIAGELRRDHPGRKVTVQIAPRLVAWGDPGLLRLALGNLFHNAWKFTATRRAARIEFAAQQTDGVAVYFVRDNGAGFDMAGAARLFEPFQRLHTEREFPGTGIGLATVRRVMRRHDGEVWAESEPDKGATFFFRLGGGSGQHARALRTTAGAPGTQGGAQDDPAAADQGGAPAVLLVDDDPNGLVLVRRVLVADGFAVHTAASGEEGLALLLRHRVAVVVSDYSMPGMSGTEFLRQVAELYPETLRIIFSGQAADTAIVEGISRGEIYRLIEKDQGYESLLACIRAGLQSRARAA